MHSPDATISDDGRALLLRWPGAEPRRIAADVLWRECPSAQGRRRRLDGLHTSHAADLGIGRVAPVGNYAVNIAFTDGHDRGVFEDAETNPIAALDALGTPWSLPLLEPAHALVDHRPERLPHGGVGVSSRA